MTREEAINVLKEYRTMVMNCLEAETPAFDMAIESLSAECPQNDTNIGTTDKCDLISRAEAVKVMRKLLGDDFGAKAEIELNCLTGYVPSADRPSGEWEFCKDEDGVYGICSVCGVDADFSHYGKPYNYCPYCGAKMKGGAE